MDTKEGIIYRLATHSDCDPTMDINRNIYGGLDYLQYKFHNFIDDPLRFPFVAVLKGQIVGFKCGYVIDDGTSLVSEATRVHPEHQGKGIMSKLDQEVMAAARGRFPSIQRTIWTAVDLERTMHKLNKDKTVKLLTERPRVGFDSTCDALKQLCLSSKFQDLLEKYDVNNISAIPRRRAINILTNHTDFAAAVPEDMLLVNFEPWGLHHQTYIELLKLSTLHVSDVNGSGLSQTRNQTISTSKSVHCFSFHSETPTMLGVRCRADFYCPAGKEATKMATAHLLYHIREFAECNQAMDVSFGMLFAQHIDKPTLKSILTDELGLHLHGTTPEWPGLLISMQYTAEQ